MVEKTRVEKFKLNHKAKRYFCCGKHSRGRFDNKNINSGPRNILVGIGE
jgi:hypothetical protein